MAPREVRAAEARFRKYQEAFPQMERQVGKKSNGRFELRARNAKEVSIEEDLFHELTPSLELGIQYAEQRLVRSKEGLPSGTQTRSSGASERTRS